MIVNPSNPVSDLTTEQVRKIYTGEITNWKDLGGADMPIVAISRDSSSGTFETFEGLIMNKQKIAGSVETVGSNPQAHSRVKTTPAAVAYVGFGFVDNEIKALKVDGIMPTRRTIAAGEYPVARPLYLFTNGYPKMGSLLYNFVNLYLTEKGQEIIEAKGFVPLTSY
jgi:phosphate transport system substrate-binding protein